YLRQSCAAEADQSAGRAGSRSGAGGSVPGIEIVLGCPGRSARYAVVPRNDRGDVGDFSEAQEKVDPDLATASCPSSDVGAGSKIPALLAMGMPAHSIPSESRADIDPAGSNQPLRLTGSVNSLGTPA